MRIIRYYLQPVLLMALAAVLLAGCSSLSRKTSETDDLAAMAEARGVLLALGGQNETLTNFKGIGDIRIWQEGKKWIDERIAWVGSGTDKLRIVVLIAGQPSVRLASDGKWFYYYEARQNQPVYKRLPATDATLQRVVSIPIRIDDIVQLLAGRTPLRKYDTAVLHKQDFGIGYVLTLKRRWWGIVEKIYLGEKKTQVHRVEFFNRFGGLIYRASFDEMQIVAGYRVPARLSISDGEGVDVQLDIQRYLTDIPVSPSMFVLNPPD